MSKRASFAPRIVAERGQFVLVQVGEREGFIADIKQGRQWPATLIAAITGRGYWREREHDAALLERIEGFARPWRFWPWATAQEIKALGRAIAPEGGAAHAAASAPFQGVPCQFCRHFYGDMGGLTCRAFPDGIPLDDPETFTHDEKLPGQEGDFVFEDGPPASYLDDLPE